MKKVETPLLKAIDLNHNKFVQACAGAGKTFALSKRYCAILDSFAEKNIHAISSDQQGPENILVITFTNQAAAEMSERIYKDLNLLLNGEEISPFKEKRIPFGNNLREASAEYKNRLRSAFPGNAISTIDSFCAKIVRAYAHKTGLDPRFNVGDEVVSQQKFNETLDDFLLEKGKQFDQNLEILYLNTTPKNISAFIRYLYQNRAYLNPWLEQWKQYSEEHDEMVKRRWLEDYTPYFDIHPVLSGLTGLTNFSDDEIKNTSDNGFIFLKEIQHFLSQFPKNVSDVEQRRFLLLNPLQKFLTKDGKKYLSRIPGTEKNWVDKNRFKEIKENIKSFSEYLQEICPVEFYHQVPTDTDFQSIPVIKALLKLYHQFESRLNEIKIKNNYLEFNDVIIMTRDLLKNDAELRFSLQKKYSHIMVDEFQDTNELRWEIIQMLASDENSKLRKKGLFIVGDRKQSIYRFNQADVEVMNSAQQALLKDNPDDKNHILIDFNANYRASQKYIHQVINFLFSKIMPTEHAPEIKPYEAFFAESGYPSGNASSQQVAEKTDICCQLNIAVNADEDFDGYLPALNTASTVKKLLGWAAENNLTESGKPVIGVLLKKFTNIQEYLQIFQQFEIPFQIVGGKNLFKQQEAFDLFHFISVLINPFDDLALVGLLRSPFFAMSDAQIHNFNNRIPKTISVFEFMEKAPQFKKVADEIKSWIHESQFKPISSLLMQILFEQKKLMSYYSESGAPQRIANLEKLITILEDMSLEGTSLTAAHSVLKYRMDEEIQMSQAEIPSSALVQLMTIHKSKGLEFPAVVIPEMNGSITSDTATIMHGKIPIQSDINNTQIQVGLTLNDETGESQKTNLLKNIKAVSKKELAAEEIRLFYVAVTRARYRIALQADYQLKEFKKGKNTWLDKYIFDAYELAEHCPTAEGTSQPEPMDKTVNINGNDTQICIASAQYLLKNKGKAKIQTVNFTEFPLPEAVTEYHEVTPHDLMESVDFTPTETGISAKNKHGAAFGSLFHRLMELELWDFETSKEQITALMENDFPELPGKETLTELQNQLKIFKQSDLFPIISSLPAADKFAEKPVSGRINNDRVYLKVSGIIDLLYQHHGHWYILDYKTDKNRSHLELYKIQIQTYLWILKQMFQIEALGQIYFSVTGETVDVLWNEDYFSKIYPKYRQNFRLTSLNGISEHETLLTIAEKSQNPLLIINPTRSYSDRIQQHLSANHLMQPSTHVTTINELIQTFPLSGRGLSPHQQRLMIQKILLEEGLETRPGIIALLNDAIPLNNEYGCSLTAPFNELPEKLTTMKRKGDWYSDADIINEMITKCDFSGKTIILNGFYGFSPLHFKLMTKIANSAADFYFIDNFNNGKLNKNFTYTPDIWNSVISTNPMDIPTGPECEVCFSIEQEVERIARHIRKVPDFNSKEAAIKIAVSSIKKYLPVIQKIFKQYQLPFQTAVRQPLLNHPAAHWILAVMELMTPGGKRQWQQLAGVFLHPLTNPSANMYAFDKWCRNKGLTSWTNIGSTVENGETPTEIKKQFKQISTLLLDTFSVKNKKNLFEVKDKLFQACLFFNLEEKLKKDLNALNALRKIKDIIQNIPLSFKLIDLPGDIDDFKMELKERFGKTESLRKKQQYGIEVLGFMDAIDIQAEYLFVAGMNEGDFPVQPTANPFIDKFPYNPWPMNMMLFKKMISGNGETRFFAPQRNNQGDFLKLSTFLEYLTVTELHQLLLLPLQFKTAKEHFSQYFSKEIINTNDNPLIIRHNDYLEKTNSGQPSPYKGFTAPGPNKNLTISAHRMDDLLKCPMRYWYSSVLSIEAADADPALKELAKTGNIVHQALETFGKAGGFEINKLQPEQACKLLHKKFQASLQNHHTRIEQDIQTRFRYRIFTDGLAEANENNMLVKLLKRHREEWLSFNAIHFEKKFKNKETIGDNWKPFTISNSKISITFNGIIDKILKSDNGTILGTDYKTGNIKTQKEISEFWSSQLLIYYLVLKHYYPEHPVILTYEQLKSKKDKEHGVSFYMGDTGTSDINFQDEKKKTKNVFIPENDKEGEDIVGITAIKNTFFIAAQKVIDGHFHITDRDEKKACEYCPYENICRKGSV